MGIRKIQSYFQLLRRNNWAAKLAFVVFLPSVLAFSPTHPLNGDSSHWIELVGLSGKDAKELLKIYSIVRLHTPGLDNSSAWAISEAIVKESRQQSLDPMLVVAVINVESRFQPTAVSSKGARGLMQIRPFVADALAVETNLQNWGGEKSLDDPIVNIKLGVYYLRHLKRNFSDLKLALTAYNWGPTEVRNRLAVDNEVPMGYARRVLSTYQSYRKGMQLPN